MHKLPVTIITGFLGSGKTTLIRHLLQNNQGRKIAILVNEFGEIGIDGDLLRSCIVCDEEDNPNTQIVELTNGCLCCTVQEEFYPTMQELLKRRDELDCILIETSGLALPKPLIQAFKWEDIRHGATVDGVITVVDADALAKGQLVQDINALNAQRQADPNLDHETPIEELFEDQLACADLVLLTKSDLIEESQLNQVKTWLTETLPLGVNLISCQKGQINPDILLGFKAAVEDNLDQRPSHHDNEEEHDHDDNIHSVEIVIEKAFNSHELIEKLQRLVKDYEIYRIKGFIWVSGKPMRLVLQGVGNRFDTFYDRLWRTEETPQTRLVLIGRNLNQNTIQTVILSSFENQSIQ